MKKKTFHLFDGVVLLLNLENVKNDLVMEKCIISKGFEEQDV